MTTRIAIVTGGGSGIGRALGAALVARGDIVVLADVDRPAVEAVAVALGPLATAVELDVRDGAAVEALVRRVHDEHGRVDLMLNNAGIGVGGPVEQLELAHWERVLDVNVRGVINGVQAAYPLMVEQGFGHIVNTASLAGLVPAPMLTPYAMSKHAVVGLSTSLRLEAAAHGVRVSALCPGPTETPILDKGMPDDLPPVVAPTDGRRLLERTTGPAYPVEQLAADALRGIDRNEALIVAPRRARLAWRTYRLRPGLVEEVGRRTVRWARAQLFEEQQERVGG